MPYLTCHGVDRSGWGSLEMGDIGQKLHNIFGWCKHRETIKHVGNWLTRRPCKGDKFEIEIFEAKRQTSSICGTCSKMFATWKFISIGRRVIQDQKMCLAWAVRA